MIDNEFLVPKSNWYDGWQQSDWHFVNESVENAIQSGRFNRDLRYLSGVTTQEASYILREITINLCLYESFIMV